MVETLVAIFILLISVTGPLAVAQSGLRSAYISRDQVLAAYIAQDAIEAIKNKRDDAEKEFRYTKGVQPSIWLATILGVCDDTSTSQDGCSIDTTNNDIDVLSCGFDHEVSSEPGCNSNYPLKIDGNGFFGFDGSENSKYYRLIKIKEIRPKVEATIDVEVGWTRVDGSVGLINVREHIFNSGRIGLTTSGI